MKRSNNLFYPLQRHLNMVQKYMPSKSTRGRSKSALYSLKSTSIKIPCQRLCLFWLKGTLSVRLKIKESSLAIPSKHHFPLLYDRVLLQNIKLKLTFVNLLLLQCDWQSDCLFLHISWLTWLTDIDCALIWLSVASLDGIKAAWSSDSWLLGLDAWLVDCFGMVLFCGLAVLLVV